MSLRAGLPPEVLSGAPRDSAHICGTGLHPLITFGLDPGIAAASLAPSSHRRGVILGKTLQRRVPAQPLAHGSGHPQYGQLRAQRQQVSVVSQWAPVGGSSLSALPSRVCSTQILPRKWAAPWGRGPPSPQPHLRVCACIHEGISLGGCSEAQGRLWEAADAGSGRREGVAQDTECWKSRPGWPCVLMERQEVRAPQE